MSQTNGAGENQGQKRKREIQDSDGNIRKKKHAPHSKKHKNRPRPGQAGQDGVQSPAAGSPATKILNTSNPAPRAKQQSTPALRRAAIQKTRQQLPIYPHAASIRDALSSTDILLLAGETGSGKSTQVPQFLLSSRWCTGRIAVTQPRRMAAISLARRVADELGTPMGKKPDARVGYSVRFDDNVGKGNRIKFLTDGMLLQEMLRDPGLSEYSCIVVDEVHERSINVDLILGFLRDLLVGKGEGAKRRKGKPLKVVIMSATADTETFKNFFEEGYRERGLPESETNGTRTNGEKSSSGTQISDKPKKVLVGIGGKVEDTATEGSSTGHVATCFVEGRQYPVQTIYLPEATQDVLEAALKCVFQVHCKEPMPGDILVFLTGQDAIQSLQKLVEEYAEGLGPEFPKVSRFYVSCCSELAD